MRKVVYNSCYGGFSLSDKAMDRMIELGYEGVEPNPKYDPNSDSMSNFKYFGGRNIWRTDPILVQVVEELGAEANGRCARLAITSVEGPYRITEYDGYESVETPDSIDWS